MIKGKKIFSGDFLLYIGRRWVCEVRLMDLNFNLNWVIRVINIIIIIAVIIIVTMPGKHLNNLYQG